MSKIRDRPKSATFHSASHVNTCPGADLAHGTPVRPARRSYGVRIVSARRSRSAPTHQALGDVDRTAICRAPLLAFVVLTRLRSPNTLKSWGAFARPYR